MRHSLHLQLVFLLGMALVSSSLARAENCLESIPVTFESGGIELQGQLFFAGEKLPSQVAIYLAGFPPSERGDSTLLVRPICEAGWGVLYFHYRGTRSIRGRFSIAHALEDAHAAVAFIKTTYSPVTLAVVGHSFGGLVALQVGARTKAGLCIVAISAPNPGLIGANFAQNPEARKGWAEVFNSFVGPNKPITSADGRAEATYFVEHAASLDITGHAEALSKKRLLLIGASEDGLVPVTAHHDPLVAGLHDYERIPLTEMVIDTDHNYTTRGKVLAAIVSAWLVEVCLSL